jgi:IS6 family transposase
MKTSSSLCVIAAGHALVQNLRRGHYEITTDVPSHDRVRLAFTGLALCL